MRVKTLFAIGTVVALALVGTAVALAAGHASKRDASTLKISTRTVPGLGKVLVNSRGRTLYMFVPDKRKSVTCHKVCAKIWPPLFLPAKAKFAVSGGVKKALLGSDKDGTRRVVTYNKWPLYLYLGDRKAGVATGQALDLNGGLWYVMAASGKIIKHKATTGGGTGSGGGGGGGTTTTPTTTGGGGGGGGTACSDDDGDGDASAGGPDDGDGCI